MGKALRIHRQVAREIEKLDLSTKQKLAELFLLLTEGENLGLPISRPMPIVSHGAHEIRLRDHRGNYRIFYYSKFETAILIFHFFKKKTDSTPGIELETARHRLEEML